jgi:hypothetical protein
MKHSLRRTISVLVPATIVALALAVPASTSAGALQTTSCACDDGTNPQPGPRRDGAQRIDEDPPPPGSGNPNTDYAVGGGRAALFLCSPDEQTFFPVETNFALNARVDAASNGSAGTGTFNLTIPTRSFAPCPGFGQQHLNARIDCVKVGGNGPGSAQATAKVTHTSGAFFSGLLQGEEIRVDVLDSGLPGGTGDMIGRRLFATKCDFSNYDPNAAVDNGNISVHQVS